MYKLYAKEQEDMSLKRWLTITKEDASNFKDHAHLENLKYIEKIFKKLYNKIKMHTERSLK